MKSKRLFFPMLLVCLLLWIFSSCAPKQIEAPPEEPPDPAIESTLRDTGTRVYDKIQDGLEDIDTKIHLYGERQYLLNQQEKLLEYEKQYRDFANGEIPINDIDSLLLDEKAIDFLNETRKKPIQETVNSDISFQPGKYKEEDMIARGEERYKEIIGQIVDLYGGFKILYPGMPMEIMIEAEGYADETPFRNAKRSYRSFPQEAVEYAESNFKPYPKDKNERRQFLNIALSYLRAKTTRDYIIHELERRLAADIQNSLLEILDNNPVGHGEEYPNPEGEYGKKDPNRRICRITGTINPR